MAKQTSFVSLLQMVQEYISQNYAAALSNKAKLNQLRSYIEKYLHDTGYTVEGYTAEELSKKLYTEMAEYSVLTKYLGRDEIEEIKGFNTTDIPKEFCLLYGEVGEAFDAWRKKKPDFGEELADVAIYLLGIAEITGVDLEKEVARKMDINENRVYQRSEDGILIKCDDKSSTPEMSDYFMDGMK